MSDCSPGELVDVSLCHWLLMCYVVGSAPDGWAELADGSCPLSWWSTDDSVCMSVCCDGGAVGPDSASEYELSMLMWTVAGSAEFECDVVCSSDSVPICTECAVPLVFAAGSRTEVDVSLLPVLVECDSPECVC